MASSLKKLSTINNIAPGQSVTKHWNNVTSPPVEVWYIQAIPLESSFAGLLSTQSSVEVEVTRVWRKLNRTESTSGDLVIANLEHEVWYTIKNPGSTEVDVEVYASIIS